jgi:GAF domain-containing protein
MAERRPVEQGAHIDADALEAGLARLRARSGGADLADVLQRLAESATSVVRASGCGVMFVDDEQVSRYVAATDGPGRLLEQAQEQAAEGPCVLATVDDHVVVTHDVVTDERWPRLGPMMAGTGVVAVLGVPLRLHGATIGSLDVYDADVRTWTDAEVDAVLAYADVVAHLVATAAAAQQQDELVRQLETALDSRVMIERAVGVLMATRGEDAVAAFQRLRAGARTAREPLATFARAVLAGRRV